MSKQSIMPDKRRQALFLLIGSVLFFVLPAFSQAQPVADFRASPISGCIPLTVNFTDLSTGSPASWKWDFGDRETSTEQNPSHTYTRPGTHTVVLIVSNRDGSDTRTRTDYIIASSCPAPTADFRGSPTSGCAPLTVNFTDFSEGSPTFWAWKFGDGATSTAQNPSHTYISPGTYDVKLTVSNGSGSDTKTRTSYITPSLCPAPTAEFRGSTTSGCTPLEVRFTDLSTGSPASWSWNFGDRGTSTAQNPSHTYTGPGTYTVELIVSNRDGSDTETKEDYITVSDCSDPAADFRGSPTSGSAPLEVTFTDLSTGSPTFWSWNFGDGASSTRQDPIYTYTRPGTYTVSLIAKNRLYMDTETKTKYITVAKDLAAPVADFIASPTAGEKPLTVYFTDQSTGNIRAWQWRFGDGATSTRQHPSHTYNKDGLYTVILTVSGPDGGDTRTEYKYVDVGRRGGAPVISNPRADPEKIFGNRGSSSLLTATVNDPDGDLVSVIINLFSLGGSSAQIMNDDGRNGDLRPGDGIYSFQATPSPLTPIGLYPLVLKATDQEGNADKDSISLFIRNRTTGTVHPETVDVYSIENSLAGQTITLKYSLIRPTSHQIMQEETCATELTVKRPNGGVYDTRTVSGTENSIAIPQAEAGTWTYEVATHCNTAQAYQVESFVGGIGTIVGTVTNGSTQESLTGVGISTDTGGVALSLDGHYVMVVPAGLCTVTASALGYEANAAASIAVDAGGTTTCDLSLTPVTLPLNTNIIGTNLESPPVVGDPVQIALPITSQSNVFFKWYSRSGIGTPTPGNWQLYEDWSMNNNIITWSAESEGRYVILAYIGETQESSDIHQGGLIIETEGNSPNPIQILEMTSDMTYPQPSGAPISLDANAVSVSGPLFYKYFYRLENGAWVAITDWSTNSEATWTPTQDGYYTLVVHVADDPIAFANPLNQAGMTCTIGQ